MVVNAQFEEVLAFRKDLAAVKKNSKWGFLDTTGAHVIRFQYENAYYFSDGLAPVQLNGLWGYINKNNEMLIQPRFQQADVLMERRAVVKIEDKYGVIDTDGTFIIKPEYDMISNYHLGVCFAVIFENPQAGIYPQHINFDAAGNPLSWQR